MKASDNAYPSILITEGTEPSAPAAGKQRVYIDSTSHHLMRTNSSGTETDIESAAANGLATDTLWDAAGDLVVGTGANTAAKLAVGTSGQALISNGTTPVWGGPAILLDYALASDITNQAITGGTFFDVIANQNFTKVYTNSLILVTVRGYGFYADSLVDQFVTRVNIDSGGTPVLKYMSGASNNSDFGTTPGNLRDNPLVGGLVFVTGLSAATHTIKVQTTSIGNNHFYCRASSAPSGSQSEFLQVQVVEL